MIRGINLVEKMLLKESKHIFLSTTRRPKPTTPVEQVQAQLSPTN